MTDIKIIPNNINERLKYFQDEVKKYFSFLSDYGYLSDKIEVGRKDLLLDYYCEVIFKNGDTKIDISYSTDILKGSLTAFPNAKERPVSDNLISCNISDPNAFMSVSQFAEITQPQISLDEFSINLNSKNVFSDITRVVKTYSIFLKQYLTDVLSKKKIFDCYTDRFYDKVFKEINYSH